MKEISNLSEYLVVINEMSQETEYYFRGEGVRYDKRVASVNRNANYNFPKMLKEYYFEIGNIISKTDSEDLIALSQHHGLHTPLLDITSSPLVALYFCVNDNIDKDGYIYTYDKGYSIDISNQLRGYNLEDLIDEFIYLSNQDFMASLFNGLVELKNNKFEFFYLIQESLVNEVLRLKKYECDYLNQLPDFVTNDFIRILTKPNKFVLSKYLDDFNRAIMVKSEINPPISCYFPTEDSEKTLSKILESLGRNDNKLFTAEDKALKTAYSKKDILKNNEDVIIYIYVLSKYFSAIKMSPKLKTTYDKFPILPYFTYNPSISFDRMSSQQGSFYYQLATKNISTLTDMGIVVSQEYYANNTIKVNNKIQIKNELENIGINQKTLFPDLDNVAEWINKKYQR